MRAEYKRDMNHNYLILYGEQEVDTSSYQVRMLAGNVLPSILKCRLQGLDGKMMFYYDITSRQSIASLYEQKKFGMEDLQLIFGSFVQVTEEMGEYLLNPGQLVLDPDYIFIDVEKKALYFCYLPGFEKEVREQFRAFTEYILPKLDHEDERAVMLGYGVYRRALEDSFHLEYIKQELYQVREGNPAEIPPQEAVFPPKEEPCEEEEQMTGNFMRHREDPAGKRTGQEAERIKNNGTSASEEKQRIKSMAAEIAAVACIVTAMIGVLTANLLGYLPWLRVEIALGSGFVLLGICLLKYLVYRRKKRKEQENWREEVRNNRKKRMTEESERSSVSETDKEKQKSVDVREITGNSEVQENIAEKAEMPWERTAATGDFGETVVLSANAVHGPASLVSREPGELATIYLKEELTIIGKLESACDAVIPMPTVSRVHGKIRKRGEEYYLTDLNSRNGTLVNGRLLKGDEEYRLQPEDEVDFAQARYVFLK